jgi:competence protein ComEC
VLRAPSLFKNRREFLIVASILLTIILTRLFLIYQDYQNLKSTKGYYYTDAQVLKVFDAKKGKSADRLLKLKSADNLDFYIYSKSETPKRYDWLRVKLKLKNDTTFWDYLKGFFANGEIVEHLEDGFDAKALVREKIEKQHSSSKIASFYSAIYLADPLNRELRDKISLLGISHLVALSGFHLGILWLVIFGLLYFPYKFLQKRYFPWRNRNIDLGFISLLVLLLFVLFVGAPPALIRSFVMLFIAWVVLIFGLELISFRLLAIALLLILAISPKLISSTALFLSFMGVFYIFLVLKWLKGYSNWFITLIAIPVGIFLLMFPIGHFFFGNTTIWQLMSPPLSILFIIFYPLLAILHMFGVGGVFDKSLEALFNLPQDSINVAMPLPLFIAYLLLSFMAIFSKKAFYATLIFAVAITSWYMGIYLLR